MSLILPIAYSLLFSNHLEMHFFPLIYRQQQAQLAGAFQGTRQQLQEALDQVDWTPERIQTLQQTVLSGPQITICSTNDSVSDG